MGLDKQGLDNQGCSNIVTGTDYKIGTVCYYGTRSVFKKGCHGYK